MAKKIPVLFLPGLLCDRALWAHQVEHLSDIAETAVADLSGHDSIAGLAAAALDRAPRAFALVGWSMGGYVAQEIMRQAPDRVIKLGLLDTSARADSEVQKRRRRGLIAAASGGTFKGVTSRLLPLLIHPDRLEDGALTATVMDMAARVGLDAFRRQQTAILGRPDGRGDLGAITCPTLVMCGREDALTPVEHHEEMAAAIAGSRFTIIEDCGHLTPVERPQAVTAVLRYWLEDG